MSLESWKKEFYPVNAYEAIGSENDAIQHSCLKWRGLREENLNKHKVVLRGKRVYDDDNDDKFFPIDAETCALCQFVGKSKDGSQNCYECPIYSVLGRSCDYDSYSPYLDFLYTGNPEPMIKVLDRVANSYSSS